ncbi:uncharacterized protein PF3D7_1120000-like [Onthophagus taurus]|uniref:uncharacterized protein PF3D7_1120000-like n=1 Tax=Onthophagus taurus TaxID=166361 RepID=UPI0039BE963A
MPFCAPIKSSKSAKNKELEDLKYYFDNILLRTEDILRKQKSLNDQSDVKSDIKTSKTNLLDTELVYKDIVSNLNQFDGEFKKVWDKLAKLKIENSGLKQDYDSLYEEKSNLFEKCESLESEVINLRHNNLVLDVKNNPNRINKDKIEKIEDDYVDLYGTYKETIRESQKKMEMMREQYEKNSEEQKEKIDELKKQLENMKNIQREFAGEIKRMGDEFQEKEQIMVQVIQKLQEENKSLKEKN